MSSVNTRLKVGILGCSDIAYRKFLPALMKTKMAVLTTVASRDIGKAKHFFSEADYESASHEELIASKNVDLVYISLPNNLHEEWTIKALENGKHVICEKPLGLSYESIYKMIKCANDKGLLLYENIMYLHHPQHKEIKKIIGSGKIGKIKILRASFGFYLMGKDNFRLNVEKGGGAFFDLVRYPLSTALYYLNGDTYNFKGFSFYRKGLNVGMNGCALTSENEIFEFSMGFEQQYESFYEIVGERGKIRIDRVYTTPADYKNTVQIQTGSRIDSLIIQANDHFALMIEYVCDLILRKQGYKDVYLGAKRLALLSDQLKKECKEIHLDSN